MGAIGFLYYRLLQKSNKIYGYEKDIWFIDFHPGKPDGSFL